MVLALKNGTPGATRTHDTRFRKPVNTLKMLNKLSVSELAELSKMSKAYISQVKNGKRPPSQQLLSLLENLNRPKNLSIDYYNFFIQSRKAKEVSPSTLKFYETKLCRFLSDINPDKAKPVNIEIGRAHV